MSQETPTSKQPRKRAYIVLGSEMVRRILKLPDDVQVRAIMQRNDDVLLDQVLIVLEGEGLPDRCKCLEGCYPTQVVPYYTGEIHSVLSFGGFHPVHEIS